MGKLVLRMNALANGWLPVCVMYGDVLLLSHEKHWLIRLSKLALINAAIFYGPSTGGGRKYDCKA